MFELFLIKTVVGQVTLFIGCLVFVMFLHHFFNFRHVLGKSFKLYLFVGVVSFVIKMVGNVEKAFWMAQVIKFFYL